jgi:multidrug efflux pump subunit AcrA (membrane-fusion protein)
VPVTISRQGDSGVSIADGLVPGDEVVARDLATLDHVLDSSRTSD